MSNQNAKQYEYIFDGIDGLRCDASGNFSHHNRPIKKQWRPGQIFVLVGKKQHGIKTLRKLARKVESVEIPF
jgi:hypothetical protein